MFNVLNDNQQCWLWNVQLWLNDQGVGVLYTNVMCAVASAHASYLESTYVNRPELEVADYVHIS
jgi:hypothetical protein